MYSWLEPLILGIVQGVTEFLPVSSSGHLELAKYFLGEDRVSEQSVYMSVILHFATALSTIVYFRKEVWSLFNLSKLANRKYIGYIIISMIPAALVGLFFDDLISSLFTNSIILVACMLMLTGCLLWFADKERKGSKTVGIKESIWIGLAQMIALVPGISRSGSTISASILLGVRREEAAKFSFLMVVPLIIGKMLKDILDGTGEAMIANNASQYIIGFIAAFITGLLACGLMVNFVKRAKLKYFTIYCFAIAIFTIIYYYLKS